MNDIKIDNDDQNITLEKLNVQNSNLKVTKERSQDTNDDRNVNIGLDLLANPSKKIQSQEEPSRTQVGPIDLDNLEDLEPEPNLENNFYNSASKIDMQDGSVFPTDNFSMSNASKQSDIDDNFNNVDLKHLQDNTILQENSLSEEQESFQHNSLKPNLQTNLMDGQLDENSYLSGESMRSKSRSRSRSRSRKSRSHSRSNSIANYQPIKNDATQFPHIIEKNNYETSHLKKTPDDIRKEKEDLILKFEKIRRLGINIPKRFNMASDIDEMRMEYLRIKKHREVENSIKFSRKMLIAGITAIEFLNNKFDPFDAKLDGWSESVHENINDYDEVFEELHEKYKEAAKMSPEIKLLMMLGGSGFMFHLSNSLFKNNNMGGNFMNQFQQQAAPPQFNQQNSNNAFPQQVPMQTQFTDPFNQPTKERPNMTGPSNDVHSMLNKLKQTRSENSSINASDTISFSKKRQKQSVQNVTMNL